MKNIEVELRSFITEEQYKKLMEFFRNNAEFINEGEQETHYFDSEEDLRIQKNNFFSKIWMKKGKIHDEAREETEIRMPKEEFEKLEKIFSLIVKTKIKWFRKRTEFKWDDISVCMDFTRGYGYIMELEKMSSEENKDNVLEELKEKFKELKIDITSREEFDKKFKYYQDNWRELIK